MPGLPIAPRVGLWRTSDQSVLVDVTIPSGASAPVDGNYRYQTITPLNLVAGTYRIGGISDGSSEDRPTFAVTGINSTDASVSSSILAYTGTIGAGFTYPTIVGGTTSFMGATFSIGSGGEVATVPTLSEWGVSVLVLGLAIMGYFKIKCLNQEELSV